MLSEVRAAVRRLAATPTFTVVAFLIITLAIAANTAIFSLVDGVLLRPLPFKDPGNLWQVWRVHSQMSVQHVRPEVFAEWQKLDEVFEILEIQQFRAVTLTGAGEPRILPAALLGPMLMQTLGVPPLLGRILLPADAAPEQPSVVLIGDRLWRTQFGGDPEVLGRPLRLDGQTHEVVGVMPASSGSRGGRTRSGCHRGLRHQVPCVRRAKSSRGSVSEWHRTLRSGAWRPPSRPCRADRRRRPAGT